MQHHIHPDHKNHYGDNNWDIIQHVIYSPSDNLLDTTVPRRKTNYNNLLHLDINDTDSTDDMSSTLSISVKPSEQFLNDPEMEIALSQISQGCIPDLVDGACVFVFKEKKETVAVLYDTTEISVQFFAVEKNEFQSIVMEIGIIAESGLRLWYDYVFLTESPEEHFFLMELQKLREFSLVFPAEYGKALCMSTRFGGKEAESLRRALS